MKAAISAWLEEAGAALEPLPAVPLPPLVAPPVLVEPAVFVAPPFALLPPLAAPPLAVLPPLPFESLEFELQAMVGTNNERAIPARANVFMFIERPRVASEIARAGSSTQSVRCAAFAHRDAFGRKGR